MKKKKWVGEKKNRVERFVYVVGEETPPLPTFSSVEVVLFLRIKKGRERK